MPKKILLVDDEPLILKGLKYSLEQDGYQTDSAMDGEDALKKFFSGEFDLILLDVMLPGLDGIEVCQRIRERSNVPIIMLTAKGDEVDKILGLELGADDYITKPFSVRELIARVKALLRRATPAGSGSGLIKIGSLTRAGSIAQVLALKHTGIGHMGHGVHVLAGSQTVADLVLVSLQVLGQGAEHQNTVQSCPTLSDLMDCSLPGSSIHGIFQARVMEWCAIAFSEN